MIVLVFGLPGSGKTYFASRLAVEINALHYNSDIIRKKIGEWNKYDASSKENVYDALIEKMREGIRLKTDVIIDATFYKKNIRDKFLNTAKQLNKPCKMIEVRASEETIKQRVSKPRPDSQADYDVYKKIKSEFEPVTEDHLVLFSDKETIEAMIQKSMAYLSKA